MHVVDTEEGMSRASKEKTMRMQGRSPLVLAAGFVALLACDHDSTPSEQRAERAAEQRAERRGEGLIDKQIAGEVAEERAALADEVDTRETEVQRLEKAPAETAAKDLNQPGGAYPGK
jgi:hypothetical protein